VKRYNVSNLEVRGMRESGALLGGALLLTGALFASGNAARAAEVVVVASIKPIQSLVAGVMEGVGAPVLLVKGTGSEHSYSLRPSEARALQDADVVFWVGETMETFLVKPLRALSGDATVIALWEAPGLTLLPTREGGMWEEHDHGNGQADADVDHGEGGHVEAREDEAQHADADHEAAEEHADRETDMHVWLDPDNAKALVTAIATALSGADPENASTYQANAARMHQQLDELDRALADRLRAVADRPYVVFHDAYQYFEHRYGVKAVGAITINPTLRPSAQRLGEIQDRLRRLDAACVFAEPQFEPALVDTVIEGTSANKGVLDPLGAALEAGPNQYFQLMNGLADSLVECLGTATSG
jgi:zinc transport system substrate-binding protein